MTDEKRIFKAIHSGRLEESEEILQYIYIKYKPLVSFVVAQYVKNKSDIEDIIQETFINFFNKVENVQSSIKSYLTVTAKNIAFNYLKKNNKLTFVDTDEISYIQENTSVNNNLSNETYNELINEMKRVLSKEDVDITLLHLVDDLKFEEIALRLNQNVSTIKTKYYRALKKFRKIKRTE